MPTPISRKRLLALGTLTGIVACSSSNLGGPSGDAGGDAETGASSSAAAGGRTSASGSSGIDGGAIDASDAEGSADGPSKTPHIVVFMLDDIDVRSMDAMLAVDLLPNIRELLYDHGVAFASSFATDAICCPSRATFFSGQYVHNHGVKDVSTGSKYIYPVDSTGQGGEATLLPVWLQGGGYRTALFGKYLNGYGTETADAATRVPAGWDQWLALEGATTYDMYGYQYNENGTVATGGADDSPAGQDDPDYQTDFLSQKITSYIDALDPATPQFLYLAPTAPHSEVAEDQDLGMLFRYGDAFGWTIRPPHRYEKFMDGDTDNGEVPALATDIPSYDETDTTFASKPGWMQDGVPSMTRQDKINAARHHKMRMASLMGVDDLVGATMNKLASRGMLSDTLVVLTGDNGFLLGAHRLAEKGVSYEEAIRVPLVIRAPGSSAPARVCSLLAANHDLAPTVLDYAGVTPPADVRRPLDGRSLRAIVASPSAAWSRKNLLVEHFQEQGPRVFTVIWPHGTVRTMAAGVDESYTKFDVTAPAAITHEHYDLAVDPFQLTNDVAALTLAKRSSLDAKLTSLRVCKEAACRAAEDAN